MKALARRLPGTTRRRPALRLVSHSLTAPRHVMTATHREPTTDVILSRISVELWTDAEWDAMAEHERPDGAGYLPGFGWMTIRRFNDPREFEGEREAMEECRAAWAMVQGE